jgi:hypothetical protein
VFNRGRGYHRYHHDGVVVLPHRVELSTEESGLPKLGLQLIRPSTPFDGGSGQAILSVVLQPNFDLKSARDYFDQLQNATPVQPCAISQGQVCFSSPQHFSDAEIIDELESSRSLNIYGASSQKLVMHLSSLAGSFWKELISDGVLLIDANLNYRIDGVSPRFGYKIRFSPRDLLTSIHATADENNLKVDGAISVASLLSIVDDNIDALPIDIQKIDEDETSFDISELIDSTKRKLFVEAVVDHIIDRFSLNTLIHNKDLFTTLSRAEDFGTGLFEWNMSEALLTQRLWSITASPFEAIAARLSDEQLAKLIEEKELPFIGSNKTPLFAYVNFAESVKAVMFLGTDIYQAASPPERPVPLNKNLEFVGHDGGERVFLHSSDDNNLDYTYAGIVVVETDRGIIHCKGELTQSSEKLLVLNPKDFSITTIPFSLDPRWLDGIIAEVVVHFEHEGRLHTIEDVLQASNPSFQFVVPEEASNVTGTVCLREISSGKSLDTEFSGLSGMAVNHFAFLECGRQTVQIVGDFTDQKTWQALEVRPFRQDHEADSSPSLVHLTPSKPETFWHWFSQSPFDAAYQYRVLDHLGNPIHAWRTVEYPYPVLNLADAKNHNIEPSVVRSSL